MTDEHSSGNTTTVADKFDTQPTATVSSLKSEDSTQQLICKSPLNKSAKKDIVKKEKSVSSKSVEAGSDRSVKNAKTRILVFLGLAQVVLGALLVGAGAVAVVKGSALSRVGAGLWAGCIAVVAGVVGVLAGINDCYGLRGGSQNGLLSAFLALSLLCLAGGNSAAILAASGLQRDAQRTATTDPQHTFQDEMEAWSPVIANISILIIASIHCIVSIISIFHLSKRVCNCLRPKQPFDHNQFDPTFKPVQQFMIVEEKKPVETEKSKNQDLCKDLEAKLQGEMTKKKKEETTDCGSANSKEKLVTHWLGRQQGSQTLGTVGAVGAMGTVGTAPPNCRRTKGVRKSRKLPPPPMMLLPAHPAHPASTLGRGVPVGVLLPPRYATLPPPAPLYYPLHDTRVRRRRSPRAPRTDRRRPATRRERDSQLTRSLERIHRKRRSERERMSEADLKRTYTGLDRAYAEQFIAVCDESRHAAERHDSLASSTDTSDSGQRDSL